METNTYRAKKATAYSEFFQIEGNTIHLLY